MRAAVACALVLSAAAAACGGGHRAPATATTPASPAAGRVATASVRLPQPLLYRLRLRYDSRRFSLSGTEVVAFSNPGATTLRAVWLRLWPNAFGSCRRRWIVVRVLAGGRAGAQREGCTALEVRLARPVAPGGRAAVALRLTVTAPPRPDRFGRYRDVAIYGNALPVLAVHDRHGWNLPPYSFKGESFYTLAARWEVSLRVPPGLAVASTGAGPPGRLVARARDFALAVGPMRVRTARAGSVLVRQFRPLDAPVADATRSLAAATAALRDYARWYGPYGRASSTSCRARATSARAAWRWSTPTSCSRRPWPTDVVHEVAHQWWYSLVGDDEWREPWLDEAFAEYSAARLPARVAPNRLGRCRIGPQVLPVVATMAEVGRHPSKIYARGVYIVGACALRALGERLGPRRMDALLRGLVARHRYGVITARRRDRGDPGARRRRGPLLRAGDRAPALTLQRVVKTSRAALSAGAVYAKAFRSDSLVVPALAGLACRASMR